MKRENNDLVTKAFLSFPDIAADVINVLLFEGEERVQSRHLLSSPTESLYVSKEGLRNQLEDAAQYEICEGEVRGVYLFANQTRIDRRMLLRKPGMWAARTENSIYTGRRGSIRWWRWCSTGADRGGGRRPVSMKCWDIASTRGRADGMLMI